ncbi:MAG: YdcF family protein [Alphaproteobacteria bacterium]
MAKRKRLRARRHPGRPPLRWAARIAALAVIAWTAGLVWFAENVPGEVEDPLTPTDAVVVLTGGSGRLGVGLAVLAEKRAKKLFVSGVYRGIDVAQLLRISRQAPQDLECCVVLGYTADDTAGNARETAAWMAKEGYSSLRLVTANYHMQRSILEFQRAMPTATLIPHPVFPRNFKGEAWWRWPGTASLILSEYTKYLLAAAGSLLGPRAAAPER